MKKLFHFLPNALTLGNLAAGATGLYLLSDGFIIYASWMILLAGLFDLLDGMMARAIGVESTLGRDLDSLADLVSFGVLPGAIAAWFIRDGGGEYWMQLAAVVAVPVAAAYRLARFNNDPDQSTEFKGLPAPANGILLGTWALGIAYGYGPGLDLLLRISSDPITVLIIALGSSLLMISRIRLLSFKIKSLKERTNIFRGIILLGGIILVISAGMAALPLIVLVYILVSLAYSLIH